MLRRDAVGDGNGFVEIVNQDDAALPFQGMADGIGAGVAGDLDVQLGLDGGNQGVGVGDQDGGGHGVVLGLGDEVGGAEDRVGRLVGQHDGFGGAKHAVDVHLALHHALGIGDENVAGAANLVNLADGFGSVGQRADGRHAANLIYGVHAGDAGGGQHGGVERFAAAAGSGQDNLADAGDAGRDGGHQHSGRVGRRSAGSVEANTLQGAHQLAEATAQVNPVAGQRGLVKLGDAAGGQFQRLLQVVGGVVPGGVQLGRRDLEVVQVGVVQ